MTAPSAGGSDLEVRIDPHDFAQLMRDIRGFDRALSTATRKRLRAAATPVVREVQKAITSAPAKQNVGLRSALAAGTKVSIKTGARSAGVSIQTAGAKLPAARQAMVRAFNKRTFRHPVFGDREVWVTQAGRPYFGVTIYPRLNRMRDAQQQALRDAAATIHAGRVSG